jgi:predicted Fe-S protein YdhL (DUF1289 family)
MDATGARIDWTARAEEARARLRNVPSPCLSVCVMDEASGLCRGCWRTLDEIAAWSTLRDDDKRAVWGHIAQRAGTPGD